MINQLQKDMARATTLRPGSLIFVVAKAMLASRCFLALVFLCSCVFCALDSNNLAFRHCKNVVRCLERGELDNARELLMNMPVNASQSLLASIEHVENHFAFFSTIPSCKTDLRTSFQVYMQLLNMLRDDMAPEDAVWWATAYQYRLSVGQSVNLVEIYYNAYRTTRAIQARTGNVPEAIIAAATPAGALVDAPMLSAHGGAAIHIPMARGGAPPPPAMARGGAPVSSPMARGGAPPPPPPRMRANIPVLRGGPRPAPRDTISRTRGSVTAPTLPRTPAQPSLGFFDELIRVQSAGLRRRAPIQVAPRTAPGGVGRGGMGASPDEIAHARRGLRRNDRNVRIHGAVDAHADGS